LNVIPCGSIKVFHESIPVLAGLRARLCVCCFGLVISGLERVVWQGVVGLGSAGIRFESRVELDAWLLTPILNRSGQGSPLRIDVPCSQCLTAEHQRFACMTNGLQRCYLPVIRLGLLHWAALLMYCDPRRTSTLAHAL